MTRLLSVAYGLFAVAMFYAIPAVALVTVLYLASWFVTR